jgi:hypothetical protein
VNFLIFYPKNVLKLINCEFLCTEINVFIQSIDWGLLDQSHPVDSMPHRQGFDMTADKFKMKPPLVVTAQKDYDYDCK